MENRQIFLSLEESLKCIIDRRKDLAEDLHLITLAEDKPKTPR